MANRWKLCVHFTSLIFEPRISNFLNERATSQPARPTGPIRTDITTSTELLFYTAFFIFEIYLKTKKHLNSKLQRYSVL